MSTLQQLQSQTLGNWLPKDREIVSKWLANQVREAPQIGPEELNVSLQHFKKIVEEDSKLLKLANDMFTEVPNKPPYLDDPVGNKRINSFAELLPVLNHIMTQGPQFYDGKGKPATALGLIGFPINAVLDWPMGTKSGYEFFLDARVNLAFQAVLNSWGTFLKLPESQECLNSWLSTEAKATIAEHANDNPDSGIVPSFEDVYVCDTSKVHLGFNTWDEFFTRKFRDGIRPVSAPDNVPDPVIDRPEAVIVNACESAPLQVKTGVKWEDTFWLKEQPYSLGNMFNFHTLAQQFVGGTVYQAFLSALSYHRWHAPVSGRVVDIELVPGTYYSENIVAEGFPDNPDPGAPNYSQPYISAVAARGIIYIEADNPDIGLMAIVFIGMAEVSSCEFTVPIGSHIVKGQEIGMFHFGGSSHCIVFRPGVEVKFEKPLPWDMDTEKNLPVNSTLGIVVKA